MADAYLIFTEDVHDPGTMGEYAGAALRTIKAAGGRVVAAGPVQPLEGSWHGTQTVLARFPSEEAARSWYESEEYRAVIGLRHEAAETNAALLPGLG